MVSGDGGSQGNQSEDTAILPRGGAEARPLALNPSPLRRRASAAPAQELYHAHVLSYRRWGRSWTGLAIVMLVQLPFQVFKYLKLYTPRGGEGKGIAVAGRTQKNRLDREVRSGWNLPSVRHQAYHTSMVDRGTSD